MGLLNELLQINESTHANARRIIGRDNCDGASEKQSGGSVEKTWTKTLLQPNIIKQLESDGHRVTQHGNIHVVATYKGASGKYLKTRRDAGYDDMLEDTDLRHEISELMVNERYDDSSEFEADVDKLESLLRDAKAIVASKNWNDWMQASKSNYDTKSVEKSKKLLSTIQLAIDSVDDIYNELSEAS